MPQPICLCLENLSTDEEDARFVQCVAVVGRSSGLSVSPEGCALWDSEERVAFELFVSVDDRLVLYVPEHAVLADVRVHRAGRSVAAQKGKPILLLDKDRLQVDSHSLRVHLHGPTADVREPRLLPARPARWKFRAAAATLALGAAIGAAPGNAAGQTAGPVQPLDAGSTGGAPAAPEGGTESDGSAEDSDAPIEVRAAPPAVESPPKPVLGGCCTKAPGS